MITLRSKTPVKFEFADGVSETVVTIASDEDSDTIKAKLQRVLDLEAGGGLPLRQPGAALAAAKEDFGPLFDAAAAEQQLMARQKTGWEALAVEDLPEH
jgi:hypothetical protein